MMLSPLQRLPGGPFTSSRARDLGVTRGELESLAATGQIIRVFRGVYWPADLPDTLINRARAVRLTLRPFCILCDRLAAWIHGVDTFEYRELEVFPPLEILVLRGNNRIRRDGCQGCERDLLPEDVTEHDDLILTTPLRTALDLGCRLGRRDALAALDGFMRECALTRDEMLAALPRFGGRRGVVQLRELVGLADPRAESPGESWTRLAIIDVGLPAPIPQHWVQDGGRDVFRLDLAYPKHKIAIEYDGRQYHESAHQRVRDERRRAWLREDGWTVIVVTKDSFGAEAMSIWIAELRTALRLS